MAEPSFDEMKAANAAYLFEENLKLKAELAEHLETILRREGRSPTKKGWIDSLANSDACDAGNRLVELGLYEKHPYGVGRRQFYRKVVLVLLDITSK